MAFFLNDSYSPLWALVLWAIWLTYLVIDPFQIGSMAGIRFRPESVALPFYDYLSISDQKQYLYFAKVLYEGDAWGLEAVAFDSNGQGPFSVTNEGRIVQRNIAKLGNDLGDEDAGWETVAALAPQWAPELCEVPKGQFAFMRNQSLELHCGYVLGLKFHPNTNDLYAADAYHGLFRVPRQPAQCSTGEEGKAHDGTCGASEGFLKPQLLTNYVNGVPLKFLHSLHIDVSEGEEGVVYFTSSHDKIAHRHWLAALMEGAKRGKLLKYDIAAKETSVVLDGLVFPTGVVVSPDGEYLIFCEGTRMRCQRHYLKGPKAGMTEHFVDVPGFPGGITLSPRGTFWIAIMERRLPLTELWLRVPLLRYLLFYCLPNPKILRGAALSHQRGMVMEVDEQGKITALLEDKGGNTVRTVTEVVEHNGKLWMGTMGVGGIPTFEFEKFGFPLYPQEQGVQ